MSKDGRLFGVDRKRGVFSYDPKTQKLSDYALYFQNENFHGPNDLIFDRQGGLYFTDPWGTSMANLRGAGPDGMAVDEKGNVYVAYFEAGEVVVLTSRGKIIGSIKLLEGQGCRPPT